jgi:hypothetical protein
VPASDYTPTLDQVAAHIMARTVNQYGVRQGTFTPDTTPTDTEATAIIAETMNEIADIVGDDIPDFFWDDASSVAAIKVASQIELSFYPEQVQTNRSPYDRLLAKYEEAMVNLAKQVAGADDSSTGAVVSGPSATPQWSYPQDGGWLSRVW